MWQVQRSSNASIPALQLTLFLLPQKLLPEDPKLACKQHRQLGNSRPSTKESAGYAIA